MGKQLVALSTALLVAACGACGGGDGETAASTTTTTRPETTTTTAAPRTPDEAFLAGLEDSDATFDENEGGSPDTALAAARDVCEALDLAVQSAGLSEDLTTTPGGHDLDQTLGDLGELSRLAAETRMRQIPVDFGDETGGIVLDLMAQHLCPQHFAAPSAP